jgi:predicted transcriptional regulator
MTVAVSNICPYYRYSIMKKRSIYLSEEMDREMRILAAKTDKHYSDVVKEALTAYMDKTKKREK